MKIQIVDPEKLLATQLGDEDAEAVIERRLRLVLTRFADDLVQLSLALSRSDQGPEVVICELNGRSNKLGELRVSGQGLETLDVVSASAERLARTLSRRLDTQVPLS